jgi:hypothetical protein
MNFADLLMRSIDLSNIYDFYLKQFSIWCIFNEIKVKVFNVLHDVSISVKSGHPIWFQLNYACS